MIQQLFIYIIKKRETRWDNEEVAVGEPYTGRYLLAVRYPNTEIISEDFMFLVPKMRYSSLSIYL